MTAADGRHAFDLAVPPLPQSVAVCRLFVGSVARHFAVDEDLIGDLKVAVSEAVTNSISLGGSDDGGGRRVVRLRIVCDAASCAVEIGGPAGAFEPPSAAPDGATTPPSGLYEGSLGLLLIRSLFPDAELVTDSPEGTAVRFTVPHP